MAGNMQALINFAQVLCSTGRGVFRRVWEGKKWLAGFADFTEFELLWLVKQIKTGFEGRKIPVSVKCILTNLR